MITIASHFTQREYKWTAWKVAKANKYLITQFDEDDSRYLVYGYDGPEAHLCFIYKGTVPAEVLQSGYTQEQNDADKADFEGNHKTSSNAMIEVTDSQGRKITKPAATSILSGAYQLHAVEFTTSKLNSIYNKNDSGVDLGFSTVKLYKEDGSEITTEGEENLAVKTVVDWMTTHPLEIIGGSLYHAVPPTSDCRMWIVAAPGILNVTFGQGGINLKHVGAGSTVRADGRATKYLPIVPGGINKMRLTFRHSQGLVYNAMMLFELFK